MRVFMLCADGLEHDFIDDRSFPHLVQKLFHRVEILRRAMTIFEDGRVGPFTPVIWEIIFTGECKQTKPMPKPVKEHWKNPPLNWLKRRKLINASYGCLLRTGLVKAGLPKRLGFKRKDVLLDENTLLSQSEKPVVVNNPLKAEVKWQGIGRDDFSNFSFEEIMQDRLRIFRDEKREVFKQLSREWDLFVFYTKFVDYAGHLFWQRNSVIAKYSLVLDRFAQQLGDKLIDESLVILSDHGMQPLKGTKYQGGEHSDHAFVSFSEQVDVPRSLKITDIYDIVVELLRR